MGKSKFTLSKVFPSISKYGDVENVRALETGKTKYISTTRFNNGLSHYVDRADYKLEKGKCITVGIDGSYKSFYQDDSFIRTTNIAILRNDNLDKYNALYIVTILDKAISIYNHGIKLKTTGVLEKLEIELPEKNGDVDWEYMTNYIKEIYDKQRKIYSTKNNIKKSNLKKNTWKTVRFIDYFDMKRGQRYKKEDWEDGEYPFVSSSEFNNGIDGYVKKKGRSKIYRDCLTIANSGSRGECFYHEGEFIASDHVHIITRKDGQPMNKYIGLYLIPLIEKNRGRFLYNKEINDEGTKELTIALPFTNTDEVDYCFMEEYVKQLPNSDLI